jgi:hypothetical protein
MSRMIREYAEVARAIVELVPIKVMRFFTCDHGSPEHLFGNDNMLKNVSLRVGAWMSWEQNLFVSLFDDVRLSVKKARAFSRATLSRVAFWPKRCPAHQTCFLSSLGRMLPAIFIHMLSGTEIQSVHCRRSLVKWRSAQIASRIGGGMTPTKLMNPALPGGQWATPLPGVIAWLAAEIGSPRLLGSIGRNQYRRTAMSTCLFDWHTSSIPYTLRLVNDVYHVELGETD